MKAYCGISGLALEISHFPGVLDTATFNHPIFKLQQKTLLSRTTQFFNSQFSPTENYLYYLALLNSTDLMRWNVPARYTEATPRIIAANTELLIRIIGRISIIKHPAFQLPQISINKDTCTLENSYIWLKSWEQGINDFLDGNRNQQLRERIVKRENALERLIKNPNKDIREYVHHLAKWANEVSEFPNMNVSHEGKTITLAEYWQWVIHECAGKRAWKIPRNDIQELIDYLTDNVETGTIFSHTLFKLLTNGLKANMNYLGFGEHNTGTIKSYELLDENASVEQANILAMIMAAPQEEPELNQFPNKFEYMKALAKWKMAQRYSNSDNDGPKGL